MAGATIPMNLEIKLTPRERSLNMEEEKAKERLISEMARLQNIYLCQSDLELSVQGG